MSGYYPHAIKMLGYRSPRKAIGDRATWAQPDPEDPSATTSWRGVVRRAFVHDPDDSPFELRINAYPDEGIRRKQVYVYGDGPEWLTYTWVNEGERGETHISLRKDGRTGPQTFRLVMRGGWAQVSVAMNGVDKMVWEMTDDLGFHTIGGRHYFMVKPDAERVRIKNENLKLYARVVGDCPVQDGSDREIKRVRGEEWHAIDVPPGSENEIWSVRRWGEGLLRFEGVYPYVAANRSEFFLPKAASEKTK